MRTTIALAQELVTAHRRSSRARRAPHTEHAPALLDFFATVGAGSFGGDVLFVLLPPMLQPMLDVWLGASPRAPARVRARAAGLMRAAGIPIVERCVRRLPGKLCSEDAYQIAVEPYRGRLR